MLKYNYCGIKEKNIKDFIEKSYVYKNLSEGVVYFNDPINFDDEYEYYINILPMEWWPIITCSSELYNYFESNLQNMDFDKALERLSEEKINEFINLKEKLQEKVWIGVKRFRSKNTGVMCFAPDFKIESFWKDYANNGCGICSEYEIDDFFDKNKMARGYIEYGGITRISAAAFFDRQKSNIPQRQKLERYLKCTPEILKEDRNNMINTMFHKEIKWKDQNEYRVILFHFDSSSFNRNISGKPRRVFIGPKVPNDIKQGLIQLCETKGILVVELNEHYNVKK